MRNLLKYAGIGLLVIGLAACDGKKDQTSSENSSTQAAQQVSLMDGKLTFSLPAGISDKSDKLATQASNMHVYADNTQQRTIIVLIGDNTRQKLDVFARRLEDEQRSRDPQLQVISNQSLTLNGHEAQELDTVISAHNQTSWSSIILTRVDDKIVTMQISLPADNQQQAQQDAKKIIDSLKLK